MKKMILNKKDLFLMIQEISNIKVESENISFIDDLKFDSMDTVVLLSMLEVDYDTYVSDEIVPELQTVHSLVQYLNL